MKKMKKIMNYKFVKKNYKNIQNLKNKLFNKKNKILLKKIIKIKFKI